VKIRPVGVKIFHADRKRTEMTKVLVAFRNSANSPKEETIHNTTKVHTISVLQEKKKWTHFTYYKCFER